MSTDPATQDPDAPDWRNTARALRRKRSANHPDGRRTDRYVVKVSPEEKRRIDQLATQSGVTPARLMREAVLADAPPASSEQIRELIHQLFRTQTALRAVGNNINQMTRVSNATNELSASLDATLTAVHGYASGVGDVIELIARSWRG